MRKKMKKGFNFVMVIMLAVFLLAACGGRDTGAASDAGETVDESPGVSADVPPQENTIRVALVTDIAGVNDQSFNQSAWEGMQRSAEELGIEISYKESKQNADYIPNLESVFDEGNDLIWGIGFAMADAILEVSELNPRQKYAIIDSGGWDNTAENLLGVLFKAEDSGYLVGFIAGKTTETDVVGFVGGMSMPSLWQFECGYRAGVAFANPEAEVLVQYAESFTDVAKGKSIASGMIVQNADVIFHAAAGLGDGVIEQCRESDIWAIGVDRDQNYLAPDNVLTSAMKRVDSALFNVNKDLAEGLWNGGSTIVYGLKEGAVGIAPSSEMNVPANILGEVKQVEEDIIAGKVLVPGDYDALEEFFTSI